MKIANIELGSYNLFTFRGMILYANVVDEDDKILCSATLSWILSTMYDRKDEITNYKECFELYVKHNDLLAHQIAEFHNYSEK